MSLTVFLGPCHMLTWRRRRPHDFTTATVLFSHDTSGRDASPGKKPLLAPYGLMTKTGDVAALSTCILWRGFSFYNCTCGTGVLRRWSSPILGLLLKISECLFSWHFSVKVPVCPSPLRASRRTYVRACLSGRALRSLFTCRQPGPQ